jgi:hypothetical protein
MALMDASSVVLLVGAVAAGFVQGLTGFAFGLVASSIWAWWLPPQLVAVMAVFGALTGQVIQALSTRREAHWGLLWPFLAGGVLGLPLGLWVLPRLDTAWFQCGLGLLLAVWCPLMLLSHRFRPLTHGGRWADGAVGLGGGLIGAFGGFTGALPTLWCTLRAWPKDRMRAVIQNFNLVMLGMTFAGYVATGLVTPAVWPAMAWVAPALLLPVLLGSRIYAGLSTGAFRQLVLVLLAAAGAALLLRSVPVLLAR